MWIYTSFFNNIPVLPGSFSLVSIAGKDPAHILPLNLPKLHCLVPKREWVIDLKASGNVKRYTEVYQAERLSIITPEDVLEELSKMGLNENVVLLCWEGPNQFCHRHLVSSWWVFNAKRMVMLGEYYPPQVIAPPKKVGFGF